MNLNFSTGRILLGQHELQVRLQASKVVMTVLPDDIRLLSDARLLLADVGAVRWQLTLDDNEQLQQIADFYGIEVE